MGNARSVRHLERKVQVRDSRKRYQEAEAALRIALWFGALRKARGLTPLKVEAFSDFADESIL